MLKKRAAIFLVISLFLFAAFVAAKSGISSVAEHLLKEHLDSWAEKQAVPNREEWERAEDFFDLALRLTPDRPGLLQLGGRLFEWRAEQNRENPALYLRELEKSLNYYRRSIRARPAWPYAWKDFAFAKVRKGELDSEFQHAFERSLVLGPWEPEIQKEMTVLGLAVWTDLNMGNRQRLMTNIQNLAIKKPKIVFEIAQSQGMTRMVCDALENQKIDKLCEKDRKQSKANRKPNEEK